MHPCLYMQQAYHHARSKVAWRFHGHLPSGLCQFNCMLEVSDPVWECFLLNCLMWIAGAQGGNGKIERPFSSLTTRPFCRRKACSGSCHHFDQYSLSRAGEPLTLRACIFFLYFWLPLLAPSLPSFPLLSSSLSASSASLLSGLSPLLLLSVANFTSFLFSLFCFLSFLWLFSDPYPSYLLSLPSFCPFSLPAPNKLSNPWKCSWISLHPTHQGQKAYPLHFQPLNHQRMIRYLWTILLHMWVPEWLGDK